MQVDESVGEAAVAVDKASSGSRVMLGRIFRLLMFVDLPIKQKFLLLTAGTLFWFACMVVVSVFSLTVIHYKYHQIAEQLMPHDRAAVAVQMHLQSLDHELKAILLSESADFSVLQSARDHVKAIRSLNAELSLRQVNSSGTVVESFVRSLVTATPESIRYLQDINELTDRIDHILDDFIALKRKLARGAEAEGAAKVFGDAKERLTEASALVLQHAKVIADEYRATNEEIYQIIRNSVHAILFVLLIASVLLIFFVRWIFVAFHQPIAAIIEQIESLSTGDINLAKKVSIRSQDEIGTLSNKFNALVDSVYGMTLFKKVIEEDSTLEDVYRRLGDVFENQLEITDYTIYEINPQNKAMQIGYPLLSSDSMTLCDPEILADCGQCRAVKTGRKVSSFEFAGICRRFAPDSGIGHICIPLMAGGNTGGVVQFRFAADEQGNYRDPGVVQRLFKAENYINQSSSVIEAKRLMQTLRDSAMVDPMTGLYNRRFLQEYTKQIISGALRRKTQIGLLICDLDYFKQVNDTYGHDAGDLILKETSVILKSVVRDSDVVIRFGGEEFLVLLLDVSKGESMLVAEKIRQKIEMMKVVVGDKALQKTISIGVAEFPEDTDGFWQGIKYADVALYRAKEQGRNRVVRFSPEMWQKEAF